MAKKGKRITKSEIRKVIRGYILRMFRSFKNMEGEDTDELIQCPDCRRIMGMECSSDGWKCIGKDCCYRFPEGMDPPSPRVLRAYYNGSIAFSEIDDLLKSLKIKK